MNAQHLSTDELADAAEGLLEEDRAAGVESHLAGCPGCRANAEALREVTAALLHRKSGDSTHVTVVTGCGGGTTPAAGPSAVLPR